VSCAKQTRSRPLAVSSALVAMHEALQELVIHAQPIRRQRLSLGCSVRALALYPGRRRSGPWRRFWRGSAMPARAVRSLPFRRSCPGSRDVDIVGSPTSWRELNSWSVVGCRTGAVRSRSGVAYLQPVPSDHVVEDRYRGGLVRSRSPRSLCRWRRSRVDDGVVARGRDAAGVVATVIAGPEPPRPPDPPLAGSRLRDRVGAASFVRRVTVSCSPWLPGARLEERFGPWRELPVEEVELGPVSRVHSSRWLDEIDALAVLRPSRADVTCSSIST
jgi:hypothetical protein